MFGDIAERLSVERLDQRQARGTFGAAAGVRPHD